MSTALRFTDAQQEDILAHFVKGGVMTAVTSAAQLAQSPGTAHVMEAAAPRVLQLAAAV